MKKINIILFMTTFIILTQYSQFVKAEETVVDKVEIAAEKTSNVVKKNYRNAKDKGCETIDGKVQCFGKKIKNKVQTISDDAATKAKELKNKIK